jgi:protein-disulfide isomerase
VVRAADEGAAVRMRLDVLEQSRGRADAPVTVVEFTDYQCPYCRRFQAQSWPRLKRDYVDTGKVRFIVRDLPLEFHSAARPAAEAAHCAGEQGHFWPMHDALLASDTKLDDASVSRRAQAMGLDVSRFRACVTGNKYEQAIARNAAEAAALGVRGTPTFIIGTTAHGELEGALLAGALPYEDLAAFLNELLAGR